MRLSAHYEACADALELSDGSFSGDLLKLIQKSRQDKGGQFRKR
jgi:hypothetical protein